MTLLKAEALLKIWEVAVSLESAAGAAGGSSFHLGRLVGTYQSVSHGGIVIEG